MFLHLHFVCVCANNQQTSHPTSISANNSKYYNKEIIIIISINKFSQFEREKKRKKRMHSSTLTPTTATITFTALAVQIVLSQLNYCGKFQQLFPLCSAQELIQDGGGGSTSGEIQTTFRIICGQVVDSLNNFSWQVSFNSSNVDTDEGVFCSGVIVAPRTLVTAAHCVFKLVIVVLANSQTKLN